MGIANVASQGNPPAAKEALDLALKTNPNSVPALLLSAELALDERRRDDAAASIQKALEVNPNSLEAIALKAGAAFAANKPDEAETHAQAALKINPRYGEVYRIVADHAARGYLFDEAAAFVRKALITDPDNAQAYADLGMYLLRTGDEREARVSLEKAFKDDPYNVSTFNSLDLLDTLDKFQTITDGDLVFKFHPDEVAVMREQAIPLAKEALEALSKRYQFTPKGPLLIEMFPKHDDFAVRTIGLPGMIGALGACFGRVVTLDSPRARKPGEFNWGETLWHELAHVITLQMSGNRVPRWLTEGISVYEGAARAARVGQGVGRLVRPGAGRRQSHQARRAERGLQRSEDDLTGLLPGLAGGGPSRPDARRAGAVEDAARLRPRARNRRRPPGRLRPHDRAAPDVVRRVYRQELRRDRARAQGPELKESRRSTT
jgi:tetratricopeptide (TPR) repeat protein